MSIQVAPRAEREGCMRRSILVIVAAVLVFNIGVSSAQESGQSVVPEKVQKMLEHSVGTWIDEFTFNGIGIKRKWINKWDTSKQYVICTGTFSFEGRELISTMLLTWDGISQDGYIQFMVSPYGNNVVNRMKIVSETVEEGETTVVTSGTKVTAKLRYVFENPGRMVYTAYVSKPDGTSQVLWKGVSTKVQTTEN